MSPSTQRNRRGGLLRLAVFLGIALFVAGLTRSRPESLAVVEQDNRLSRKLRQALRGGEIVV